MKPKNKKPSYHEKRQAKKAKAKAKKVFTVEGSYDFENFFHPFVGELIARLNYGSLKDIMDPSWQNSLKTVDPTTNPPNPPPDDFFNHSYNPTNNNLITVTHCRKEIEVAAGGPYANYNWELFFHIPLTIAVHLSKTQRFAEAQKWFHYIFNPTCNDSQIPIPQRFWKFIAFAYPDGDGSMTIDNIISILSTPGVDKTNDKATEKIWQGYQAILDKPFQPHAVARTRHIAYQYSVVMKYLDNLIAWGDNLFQQDTVESINEATQLYVLAANILGPRPQRIPTIGKTKPKTFAQLRSDGLGPIGDALEDLEGQFPINLNDPSTGSSNNSQNGSSPLFGIGRTLYFCVPRNDKLLGYWDTMADRLFKIRHCMNIQGVVRPLALFDPPIDPGMLVKAAAAGIDVSSIVNGLNQPVGPMRALHLIQKALELCGEVRGLGGAFLSALEKGDAEHLALVRQGHEINIQQMTQEVRFLQWKSAQEATTSLLTSRKTALERLHYYQRLLGLPADTNAPDEISLDHRELTEENFDEAYSALVGQYDKTLTTQKLPNLKIAGDTSPAQQSAASGQGRLYLSTNEDADLNIHGPAGHLARMAAMAIDTIHGPLAMIPDVGLDIHYWGLGGHAVIFGGTPLTNFGRFLSSIANSMAAGEEYSAAQASKTAGFERRADDWMLQYNLVAHELMQIGRQILTSLIAEQIAHHEYLNIQKQIANAQEVDQCLHDKFTNEDLYLWMQGEISRLYYDYYRFAVDTARKAERTMKQELMRPELDAQDFVKFNYWDGGRKGLLSGEALHLDVKRMEMAYHDNNRRELELTKHVSLRQLNPLALLTLKATGSCVVNIPEWIYDLDCPLYMRRIKYVALTIPSVVGPYTSVNCTLSLLRSSLRKSPLLKDGEYLRDTVNDDDRFVDYIGAVQSVVTSSAQNDSGMFEANPNLHDERLLPFEGAGAICTLKLDLPKDYPAFDYATISDVVLHIRYTARQGVEPAKVKAALDNLLQDANQSGLALLFSLRHDFPNEWSRFVNATDGSPFAANIRRDYFPYFTQGREITISIGGLELYDGSDVSKHHPVGKEGDLTNGLSKEGLCTLTIPADDVLTRASNAEVFLIVRYTV